MLAILDVMKDSHSPTTQDNQAHYDANEAAYEAAHMDAYGDEYTEYDEHEAYADEAYAYESYEDEAHEIYDEEYDSGEHYDEGHIYDEPYYDDPAHYENGAYDDNIAYYGEAYIPEDERLPLEPRWTQRRVIYLLIALVVIIGLMLLFVLPLVTQLLAPPSPTPIQPGSML